MNVPNWPQCLTPTLNALTPPGAGKSLQKRPIQIWDDHPKLKIQSEKPVREKILGRDFGFIFKPEKPPTRTAEKPRVSVWSESEGLKEYRMIPAKRVKKDLMENQEILTHHLKQEMKMFLPPRLDKKQRKKNLRHMT
tara:strand:+ start:650 stop:1060 length:411 start_codon:yes stop_codon:yes gene_type:complete